MEKQKKYRYPGINSFEITDTDIFFGRDDDREKLADLVEIEKNVLLYSRSGLGKSSLLKAALIPELSGRGYQPYYIRLGLYQKENLPPVQNIIRRTVLAEQKGLPKTFLEKFINRTHSLWYAFKSLQLSNPRTEKPVVLIFDQFEEIGGYPGRHLSEFKQQIAELLYIPIPKDYLEALKENLLEAPLSEAELDLLYVPLRVKVVFAIRSDQMSVINKLSDYLPNVLKVFYELKPLSRKQAVRAVVEPSKKKGAFITPVFEYRPEALEKILKALASKKNTEIDTAQLQILLQYIEQDLVEARKVTNITAEDLGDLNKVYENYYRNSLDKLKTKRRQAQELIEDKLIAGGRRISYDMALCLQIVNRPTLDTLIDTRLLRREPNTMGSYSYEVSHDSLVAPILKIREKRKRREEERRQKEEFEKELAEQRKKQRQQRLIIGIAILAFIISLSFGLWAFSAQKNAKASLNQAEVQKTEAQKNLIGYIQAEIKRDSIEREQLLSDKRTYVNSKDLYLERKAASGIDSLEKEMAMHRKTLQELVKK